MGSPSDGSSDRTRGPHDPDQGDRSAVVYTAVDHGTDDITTVMYFSIDERNNIHILDWEEINMAKISEEAAKAQSNALKGRTVKRIDVGDKFTSISRVTYNGKGEQVGIKRIGTVDHG